MFWSRHQNINVEIRKRTIYVLVLISSDIVCWIKSYRKVKKKDIGIFTLYFSGSRMFNSLTVSFFAACNSYDTICYGVEAGILLTASVELLNLCDVVLYIKSRLVAKSKGVIYVCERKKVKSHTVICMAPILEC